MQYQIHSGTDGGTYFGVDTEADWEIVLKFEQVPSPNSQLYNKISSIHATHRRYWDRVDELDRAARPSWAIAGRFDDCAVAALFSEDCSSDGEPVSVPH
jgi:hypothetical protein